MGYIYNIIYLHIYIYIYMQLYIYIYIYVCVLYQTSICQESNKVTDSFPLAFQVLLTQQEARVVAKHLRRLMGCLIVARRICRGLERSWGNRGLNSRFNPEKPWENGDLNIQNQGFTMKYRDLTDNVPSKIAISIIHGDFIVYIYI